MVAQESVCYESDYSKRIASIMEDIANDKHVSDSEVIELLGDLRFFVKTMNLQTPQRLWGKPMENR